MIDDPTQPALPGLERSERLKLRESASAKKGRELRDDGMERAIIHAGDDWRTSALTVVRICCRRYLHFTSDDVHRIAESLRLPPPPDGRAWGSVMRTIAFRGWATKTSETIRSTRPVCHAGPKPVYRSHVFEELMR